MKGIAQVSSFIRIASSEKSGQAQVTVRSTRRLPALLGTCLALVASLFGTTSARAGIETLPSQTLIISMDDTLQGNFNLRACGLVARPSIAIQAKDVITPNSDLAPATP